MLERRAGPDGPVPPIIGKWVKSALGTPAEVDQTISFIHDLKDSRSFKKTGLLGPGVVIELRLVPSAGSSMSLPKFRRVIIIRTSEGLRPLLKRGFNDLMTLGRPSSVNPMGCDRSEWLSGFPLNHLVKANLTSLR